MVPISLQSFFLVCHDIDQWPYPEAGHTLQLPLMGNVMQVRVTSNAKLILDKIIPQELK